MTMTKAVLDAAKTYGIPLRAKRAQNFAAQCVDIGREQAKEECKYQGYTNYETWAVMLWINNEQGTQEYWRDAARECLNDPEMGKNQFVEDQEQRARIYLANRLKDEHDEQAEQFMDDQSSVFADLMNGALGSVNWHEVAHHIIEAVKEG